MSSTLKKLEDNTIQLTITIPAELVKKTRELVMDSYIKQAELPGFRKGKAPKKLVEEKIDPQKVQEEILNKLLPEAYMGAIKDHNLKPVLNPKIHVEKLGDTDWEFIAITCEAPIVELGKYKDGIQKITAKTKIIIPGNPPAGGSQPVALDEIVKMLLENVTITIPGILVEYEVDRLLSQTLDEIKRLGLTLDQYLSSTGKTAEQLRTDYGQKAKNDIKLEFTLQKIAEEEKITIEEKEIEEAIQKAKDDAERKNLEANKYLLASILRQQKTLDFLRNL